METVTSPSPTLGVIIANTPQPHSLGAALANVFGLQQVQKIYIGIDPGVTTGIAVYNGGGITALQSGSHSQMLLAVIDISRSNGNLLSIILEDVHADKTNFVAAQFIRQMMANPALAKKMPSEKKRMAYCINAACKRSRDSGMTAGFAMDWKALFAQQGITYATLAPSMRDNAAAILSKLGKGINPAPVIARLRAPTKLNAGQFKTLTGCQLPSNEHTRDAATLVWWYAKEQERISMQ